MTAIDFGARIFVPHQHRGEAHRLSNGNFWISPALLIEAFSRIKCGICGPNPVPHRLITAVQMDYGYCLDAPSMLPAGGMQWAQLDEDSGIPEQITTEREP